MADSKEKLFSDFPSVSTQEWMDKIMVDLKGADYEKKLVWKTNEGFKVKPFYRQEDLEGLKTTEGLPGEYPYIRGNKKDDNIWYIRQDVRVEEPAEANQKALDLLNKGIDSLGFHIKPKDLSAEYIATLLKDICCDCIEINFTTCQRHSTQLAELLVAYFKEKGYSAVKVNSRKGGGIKSIQNVIQEACKEKMERDRKRGILNRPVRAMVVGIPNVGKSTFINSLAGKACAKTGNKPGVTKGKQWIRLNKNVELLDTPGILWPKFEDQAVGLKLAFIGSIKDEILQTEELASELVDFINRSYPGVLEEKYAIEHSDDKFEVLEKIAQSRHCLVRGNEFDTEKAAAILLDDFRNGRLGRITLEVPEAV